MRRIQFGSLSGLVLVTALAGCAGDNAGLLTTATVPKTKPAAVKADPRCVTLLSKIEALKTEGTVAKVEKAAEGKTRSVMVKRAALSKVAELNKAYAEYQQYCSSKALMKSEPKAGAAVQKTSAKQPVTTGQAVKKAPATVKAALKAN